MSPIHAPSGAHPDPFIVHLAGPMVGARQACTRCGHALIDYTGQEIAVALQPGETEPAPLGAWAEGAQVATLGGASFVIEGRPLEEDEQKCRPAS
ncbi:MAG TPA: hypothetical protein VIP77_04950 [Jiangellaceae bacterium]